MRGTTLPIIKSWFFLSYGENSCIERNPRKLSLDFNGDLWIGGRICARQRYIMTCDNTIGVLYDEGYCRIFLRCLTCQQVNVSTKALKVNLKGFPFLLESGSGSLWTKWWAYLPLWLGMILF